MIVDHPQLVAGRYRIDAQLGRGGMGTVFAGHDLRLDRDVAVKLLRDDLADDPAVRRRFEREARAAARVAHPHAVAIFDTGEDADHDAFIVMERLSGRTLGHELADAPLSEARLREVATQVLGALGVAHAEGIVHRDVKPGNILLADDGSVKVGDFGIATTLDAGDTVTAVPLGTTAYTAPERLRGFAATPRSDLYSLGVVLYEAATGVRPFGGGGAGAVAESVVAGVHQPLPERRPDLSPALLEVVERALATDPSARFADAGAMATALDATTPSATATIPLAPATPTAVLPPRVSPAATPGVVPPSRGHGPRVRAAVAVAVVALLLVVAAVALAAPGDGPPVATAPTTPTSAAPAAVATPHAPPLPAALARALDRLERAARP